MASVGDVCLFIAKQVEDTIYPGGNRLPGIINAAVKIYPGWPVPGSLESGIDAGGVHISVWPLPAERKLSCALGRPWRILPECEPSLQITVNGNVISFSGVSSALTNVGLRLDGKDYSFQFRPQTTAEEAVKILSGAFPHIFTVGRSLYVLNAENISVTVTTAGLAVRELHRQVKDFQVTVWAPSPVLRERIGSAIDGTLSEQCHIDLNDGVPAQLLYLRQFDSDKAESWHVYRRDLFFSVNFATTQTMTAPEIIHAVVSVNGQPVKP
ncbi:MULTISPECIES: hypothetical protein [Pantoea]|uniref:hypothetical protein n=1 Tax=Pantoea TaxID=53335 RepID=UPI0004981755|nr:MULTISPECIES: hypothetical protein [Pantoea]MCS3401408.1 hypothetical protein [Pantoea sp. B566]